MYYAYFGLTGAPFSPLPPLDSMFMGPAHREALAALRWGLEEPAGFTMLTGEAGTGKTTLIRALLASAGDHVRLAYVGNPGLSFDEMLSLIAGQIRGAAERPGRLAQLEAIALAAEKNRVAIVFDEAQQLDDLAMESLRLLSQPLGRAEFQVQIILVGQPELTQRLAKQNLRQLNQRIGARASIAALLPGEVREYMALRVRNVGGEAERIFTPAALHSIAALSRGIPRRIDVLCRNAMMIAFLRGALRVEAQHVAEAVAEYDGAANLSKPSWIRTAAVLSAVGILVGAAMLLPYRTLSRPSPGAGETARPEIAAQARRALGDPPASAPTTAAALSPDAAHWTLLGGEVLSNIDSNAFSSAVSGDTAGATESSGAVVVREGDSLADIARRHLGPDVLDGVRVLMQANPQIENADLIFPGQKIRLSSR